MYERTFQVSWAQLDSNAHMANTAYLDIVVDSERAPELGL